MLLRGFGLFGLFGFLVACGGGGSSPTTGSGTSGPDTAAPKIISATPADNASGVLFSTSISATFDEEILVLSQDALDLILEVTEEGTGDHIWGSATYTAGSRVLSYTPSAPLKEYTRYTISANLFSDTSANVNLTPVIWSFVTQDLTPPISSASEVEGDYSRTLSVTLSCDDANGSGCATIYYSLNGSAPGLIYTAPLPLGEGSHQLRFYSVDNEANVSPELSINYRVDLTPPVVESLIPADGAVSVATNANIIVTFNEDIDPASLIEGTITLDNQINGTISYDQSTLTATFKPDTLLECNLSYNVSISGVADIAGNIMSSPHSTTFTTVSECDEPKTLASPNGGIFKASSVDVNLSCTDVGSGCARIIYTTDGSIPSFEPLNGTIVNGNASGPVSLGPGENVLHYFSQDNAGNEEVLHTKQFSVSNTGYLFTTSDYEFSRGIGPVPDSFEIYKGTRGQGKLFLDGSNNRLYSYYNFREFAYTDNEGSNWHNLPCCTGLTVYDMVAMGSEIWLATSEGLIISKDSLKTWTVKTTEHGLSSNAVRALVVRDFNIYLLQSSGLSISRDKGNSFTQVSFITPNTTVHDLYISDNASGNNIYVGTDEGLYISTDDGLSFAPALTSSNTPGLESNFVYSTFVAGNTIYLTTGFGVAVSTDNGANFVTTGITGGGADSLLVQGSTIYATAYSNTNDFNSFGGLSISTDGGATFSPALNEVNGLPIGDISDLLWNNGSLYLATGAGLSVSRDAGQSFINNSLNGWDYRDVYVSGNNVYVASDRGLSISNDNGYTFVTRTMADGLGTRATRNVIEHGTDIYVGTTQGLSISTDGGLSFIHHSAANGVGTANNPIVNDLYSDGSNIFIATNQGLVVPATSGPDDFNTLTTANGLSHNNITSIYADGGTLYLSSNGGGINVSSDNGSTWSWLNQLNNGLSTDSLNDIYVSGSNLYVTTADSSGLNISTDSGQTFSVNNAADARWYSFISGFNNYMYLTSFDGLAISSDNGASFVMRTEANGFTWPSVITKAIYTP